MVFIPISLRHLHVSAQRSFAAATSPFVARMKRNGIEADGAFIFVALDVDGVGGFGDMTDLDDAGGGVGAEVGVEAVARGVTVLGLVGISEILLDVFTSIEVRVIFAGDNGSGLFDDLVLAGKLSDFVATLVVLSDVADIGAHSDCDTYTDEAPSSSLKTLSIA